MDVERFKNRFEEVITEVSRVLVGQQEVVEQVMIATLTRGHVLIEGVPGLGKTLLVRALSHVLGATFKRIQFTPDLMPSDVTGSNVFNIKDSSFKFVAGPVFTQLLLADEINRAPAKTQSALLEAMQDRSVTVDGVTHALPMPFLVVATQNPVESQGTYPLPEAQLDRFLLKVEVRHPSKKTERRMLTNYLEGFDPTDLEAIGLRRVLDVPELLEMQNFLGQIRVEPDVVDYVTEVVTRTRSHSLVYLGASPRGSVALLTTSRAFAVTQGRDFVTPDDVKAMAPAVLRHRLLLHPDAELEGVTADQCVESVLRDTAVPKTAA